MNKNIKLLAVISAVVVGLVFTNAYAGGPMKKGLDRGHADEWIGTSVTNTRGEDLGKIDDFVFDRNRITFVLISYNDFYPVNDVAYDQFYRATEKLVAVPASAISFDQEDQKLVLDVSMERLKSAPVFDKHALADRKNAEEIYRYFGQRPHWTEEEME